jgi:hypothetical protein
VVPVLPSRSGRCRRRYLAFPVAAVLGADGVTSCCSVSGEAAWDSVRREKRGVERV